jgi:hypothetical protein
MFLMFARGGVMMKRSRRVIGAVVWKPLRYFQGLGEVQEA